MGYATDANYGGNLSSLRDGAPCGLFQTRMAVRRYSVRTRLYKAPLYDMFLQAYTRRLWYYPYNLNSVQINFYPPSVKDPNACLQPPRTAHPQPVALP